MKKRGFFLVNLGFSVSYKKWRGRTRIERKKISLATTGLFATAATTEAATTAAVTAAATTAVTAAATTATAATAMTATTLVSDFIIWKCSQNCSPADLPSSFFFLRADLLNGVGRGEEEEKENVLKMGKQKLQNGTT